MPRTSLPDGRNKRISEWHLEFAFTLGTSLTTEGDIVLNAGTFQTSLPLPGNLDCNLAISTVSRLSEISCSIGGEGEGGVYDVSIVESVSSVFKYDKN